MKRQKLIMDTMFKILLVLLFTFGCSSQLLAGAPVFQAPANNQMGVWKDVGSPGFSSGKVDRPHLAIDSNNTPYVAYRDEVNSNKATVMKYDGSSYQTIHSIVPDAETCSFTYHDESFDGDSMYYVRLFQVDERWRSPWALTTRDMAWSSPIWISKSNE